MHSGFWLARDAWVLLAHQCWPALYELGAQVNTVGGQHSVCMLDSGLAGIHGIRLRVSVGKHYMNSAHRSTQQLGNTLCTFWIMVCLACMGAACATVSANTS